MASTEQKKLQKITSPKGVAKYPWLNRPDTQYNELGVFKVSLLIPKEDASDLCALLDAEAQASYEKAVSEAKTPAIAKQIKLKAPYAPEVDDEGNETGNIEFKFKMNHQIKTKTGEMKKLYPFIFDAKGKQIKKCPAVYGGSILRVNFSPAPYFAAASKDAGVSLRINAVQIIELVSGGGNAGSYGFGEEEGFEGYNESEAEGSGAGDDAGTGGDF